MDCVSQICRSVQAATLPCDRIQKRKVPEILAHPGKNINETFPAHSQDSILMPSRLSFPRVLYSSRQNERPSMHTVKYQCFDLPCHDKNISLRASCSPPACRIPCPPQWLPWCNTGRRGYVRCPPCPQALRQHPLHFEILHRSRVRLSSSAR